MAARKSASTSTPGGERRARDAAHQSRLQRFREATVRWITRRHANDHLEARLTRDRLYLLPTRAGWLLAAVILVMLAGAINYSNNMGFLLTFLIFGIAHNALWYTHRNLAGLTIRAPRRLLGEARSPSSVVVTIAETRGRARESLVIEASGATRALDRLEASAEATIEVRLPERERGVHTLPRLRIETRYPLGLLRCWSWLHFDTEMWVAPRPARIDTNTPRPSGASAGHRDQNLHPAHFEHTGDPDAIRDFQSGDPLARISWKTSARLDRWMVREADSTAIDPLWLRFANAPGTDAEERLEWLTGWAFEHTAENQTFGLDLPDEAIDPGFGPQHLDACRYALAGFGRAPAAKIEPTDTEPTKTGTGNPRRKAP